jgi:hypothetical protein
MMKTILLVNAEGAAQSPAILCAENAEEAGSRRLPLFTSVFSELIAGKDLYPNGDGYDLFDNGKCVGTLEILAVPYDGASIDGKR